MSDAKRTGPLKLVRTLMGWGSLVGLGLWVALVWYALANDLTDGTRESIGAVATPVGLASAGAGAVWILIRMIMGLGRKGHLHDDDFDEGGGAAGYGLWGGSR